MFERILSKSEKMLKFFVKIQCFFAFVVAIIVFCIFVNVSSREDGSVFWTLVISAFLAVLVWFLVMGSAWAVYAFAELVAYTKQTHEELSNLSKELAEYTQATSEELHRINSGLQQYTAAMGNVMNSMNKNLYLVAKHSCAERARANAARPQTGKQQPKKEEN